MDSVICSRCGREAFVDRAGRWTVVPHGWEGTVAEAVCPGCQLAEWHPRCTSIVEVDGERINFAVISRDEIDPDRLVRCDYIDLSIVVTDGDANWPTGWRCSRCGGTEFEWVHQDPAGGLQPGSFLRDARSLDWPRPEALPPRSPSRRGAG